MTERHVVAHIRMPHSLRVRLRVLAAQRGTSMRRLAVEAFEKLLTADTERGAQDEMERGDG